MKKYKINKGYIIQKIEDKTVIFDSEESVLHTFNETATYIFNKLKAGWDKERIIEHMVKTYKTKKDKMEKDYEIILKNLLKNKIITLSKY